MDIATQQEYPGLKDGEISTGVSLSTRYSRLCFTEIRSKSDESCASLPPILAVFQACNSSMCPNRRRRFLYSAIGLLELDKMCLDMTSSPGLTSLALNTGLLL